MVVVVVEMVLVMVMYSSGSSSSMNDIFLREFVSKLQSIQKVMM